MLDATKTDVVEALRESVHQLTGAATDYNSLIDLIGNARLVLIGEASHGTHEFYEQRAEITKRLIQEKGFTAVAVEADWPDAYRVNRYVQGVSKDLTPADALLGFQRFPNWMWRNTDVVNFVNWLREYNVNLNESGVKVGFYGLDLYSMYASMAAVLDYLEQVDPEAASRARSRYACLEDFGEDTHSYGYATSLGISESCEEEVVRQLRELQNRFDYTKEDGRLKTDEFFYAEQNARIVKNAEAYYRAMFTGKVSSWNIRDRHMAVAKQQRICNGCRG